MNRTDAILDRLRTERQLAENGGHPVLANSFKYAIEEIQRLREPLKQSAEFIEELVRPRGNESSMHMWARGIELASKARLALGVSEQFSERTGK